MLGGDEFDDRMPLPDLKRTKTWYQQMKSLFHNAKKNAAEAAAKKSGPTSLEYWFVMELKKSQEFGKYIPGEVFHVLYNSL